MIQLRELKLVLGLNAYCMDGDKIIYIVILGLGVSGSRRIRFLGFFWAFFWLAMRGCPFLSFRCPGSVSFFIRLELKFFFNWTG